MFKDSRHDNDYLDYDKVEIDLFSANSEEAETGASESAQDENEKKGRSSLFKKKKSEGKTEHAVETQAEEKKQAKKSVSDFEDEIVYLEADPNKKGNKKKFIIGGAIVGVALITAVAFVVKNIKGDDGSKVYVESVGEITGLGSADGMNNRYTGEVEAQDSWKIELESGMSVAKCYVAVGKEVKKGDKLFSYNTEELKLNLDRVNLEIDTLTNEINQLNKDIVSYQNDLKDASTSEKIELQTQILTAQTTIKKNEFTIKSDQDQVKTIEKNIKDATVTSKMDGVVKSINKSLGQGSDSDSDYSSSSDSAYMTILAIGDYRVKGKISETNIWEIAEGDSVIVRSRVDDSQTWAGTISKVKTDATSDEGSSEDDYSTGTESSSSYYFYVALQNSDKLMMGQHVLIEIDYGQDSDREGIWLPSSYIHVEGEDSYVWVSDKDDKLALQKVQIGEYDDNLEEYQILDGVTLQDYIACDDTDLRENMKTTKVYTYEDSSESWSDEDYGEVDYSGDILEEGDYLEEGSASDDGEYSEEASDNESDADYSEESLEQ